MKKILVIALLGFIGLEAYDIKSTYWSGDTKFYNITCNNGKNTTIQYFPSAEKNGANAYYGENNSHKTLNKAVNECCSKKSAKDIRTLKKGSIICPTGNQIKLALRSELHYSTINFDVGVRGKYKNCFNAPVKNMKAIVLKHYNQEKGIVDGYYKINGNGKIYYTRTNSFY